MHDLEIRRASYRRAQERSVSLLIVGLAVLMPPLARIANIDIAIWGFPAQFVYVFFVWALLIFGAATLARPLRRFNASQSISQASGGIPDGPSDRKAEAGD